MNAIEKGRKELDNAPWFHDEVEQILEKTAIAHAKERVIEELETLSDKIPKPGFGDMAGVMIQNIIDYQIANLRDR